jgi:hypothetical protein
LLANDNRHLLVAHGPAEGTNVIEVFQRDQDDPLGLEHSATMEKWRLQD